MFPHPGLDSFDRPRKQGTALGCLRSPRRLARQMIGGKNGFCARGRLRSERFDRLGSAPPHFSARQLVLPVAAGLPDLRAGSSILIQQAEPYVSERIPVELTPQFSSIARLEMGRSALHCWVRCASGNWPLSALATAGIGRGKQLQAVASGP